ncbi:EamA family transporter [Nocardia seriolae]|uniref:Amino-acid metabolite efflux pump n=1 Tax=Nocardia seriolae TaxID=37332 RepID=A0ABC8AL98_9NOCA|nr:EamA family transporter [Nocardia seriolae]APA95019.1 putative amino-acid metabolite efflux pump [Nocardia seriolae]MTJ60301.1 EamA family transporter [Nocardia seriolae]MTJ75484.1 EamA family transporter [Nocardia seriolae]MTJ85291.1 EamA family transporter [Nocardia seriolae]MTK29287.1 EamA family transporter [Nocardia seriolae]
MTNRDRLFGLTVVVLWGLNFLAIHVGLEHFPPFFFAGLRFAVIAIPVLLFVPRPKGPWRWLLLYGAGFGILQFAFLFTAMRAGMPTGLSSLVLQSSAPFTVLLGAILLRERLRGIQLAGIAVAMVGMGVIGWDRSHSAALLPLLLTLAGGLGWAFGNIGSRLAAAQSENVKPLHLTLWMAVVPPIPMFTLSALTEGPTTGWNDLIASFSADGWPAFAALAYIVGLGTIAGSGLWTYLMSRYPAGTVAPLSLAVPVVGIAASWVFLRETPSAPALIGAAIVIAGAFTATSAGRRAVQPVEPIRPAEPTRRAVFDPNLVEA